MTQRLIVLGGGPGVCDRARIAGAELTLVNPAASLEAPLLGAMRRTLVAEYDDPSLVPMLKAWHAVEPFHGVIALTELALLPAARINDALGLPGVGVEVVERTRDKVLMREWLALQRFPSVPADAASSSDDIHRFALAHGYPVIAKPRRGQGSQSVRRFDDAEQVRRAAIAGADLIVERVIEGPEFSVESFSFGRRHVIYAVTGKMVNEGNADHPYVEVGHVVPAPISRQQHELIVRHVLNFLDVMGIHDTCAHTELRLTPAGPRVIETHTRVGGDSIPTLVRHATGADLIDMAAHWPLGLIGDSLPAPRERGAAAIRFFTPRPGQVLQVTGVERWRSQPGVVTLHLPLKPGDIVRAPRDSISRAGYVVCTGHDAAAAMQACEDVLAGITIDTQPQAVSS
jgi:biotin carboxylase